MKQRHSGYDKLYSGHDEMCPGYDELYFCNI